MLTPCCHFASSFFHHRICLSNRPHQHVVSPDLPRTSCQILYPTFALRLSRLFLHPKQMGAQAFFKNILFIFLFRCLICNISNTSAFPSLQFWQIVYKFFLTSTFGNCMSGGDCGFVITAVNSVNLLGTVDKQSCRTSQVFQARTL
jgi:hypothetical protein